jgi:hypothetical protein
MGVKKENSTCRSILCLAERFVYQYQGDIARGQDGTRQNTYCFFDNGIHTALLLTYLLRIEDFFWRRVAPLLQGVDCLVATAGLLMDQDSW